MSITLLLEKYDVSTDEGLQKALNEIEKEELEVDDALSGALSRACMLEGRLRAASQAYTKLNDVKSDAQVAADMVDRTAVLARDVSAKVRQLDLARSCVAECQRRVHDLIDLQLCSAGVEAAIKAHDYETGAAHVSRFLSMDPGSVAAARARGTADPRDAMTRAANTLRDHLVRKFDEAARKEDEASIERLFKLFPQIGCADEGVDLLAKYLATQAEASIRRACVVPEVSAEAAVFADAVTRVVEAAGAAVERARRATPYLPRALKRLQPVVCSGVRRVYSEMASSRLLSLDPRRSSPLAAEPALAELALIHSRISLYFNFLRRKTEVASATLTDVEKKAAIDEVEKIIQECDLMRTAQDVLGHYLELERYFMEESVGKALKLATPAVGATTSSLVDDVFYIARKVIRRAVSSGSVDGACAVLNDVSSLLERDVASALRRWLRAPPPEPLQLPPPRGAPGSLGGSASDAVASLQMRLNRDLDAQRLLYLAHTSEAEAGAEWSTRLAEEACSAAAPLARAGPERAKLESCAGGLGGAAAAFRAAHDLALAALAAALKPRLLAWAERLAAPDMDIDEAEDDADACPQALEQLAEAARSHISPRAAEALLLATLTELATRTEARILHNHYDREGGLAVERRARRLASWAGTNAAGARERCARLTQASALLALEHPSHARDALLPTPRLAAPDAKDILARRTDFKIEDIKRLKL